MMRILLLGAGVQSSTVAKMVDHGILPRVDYGLFADTGDEDKRVYEWLSWLEQESSFPIVRCGRDESISDFVMRRIQMESEGNTGGYKAKPPWFSDNNGEAGIIFRNCTADWKIDVLRKKTKELLGLSKTDKWPTEVAVESWLGISLDEKQRMKVAQDKWQRFWHPLIEGPRPLHRSGCVQWMRDHGYPEPPESSCWHCPFHSNARWRDLRDNQPEEWGKAVEFDRAIRSMPGGTFHGLDNQVYLHRQLVPLDEAIIDTNQKSLFDDECHGVCGV